MKVKMAVSISGTRDGRPWPPRGQVVDLPDSEAAQLCSGGLAEPIADLGRGAETATPPEPELRDEPKKRGRPKLPRDEHGNVIRD